MNGKKYLMNECMHDYAKEHGEVKFTCERQG